MTSQGLNARPLSGKGEYYAYIACNLESALGAVKCAYGPFSRGKYAQHPCITQEKKNGRVYQFIQNMRNGATAGFKYFDLNESKKLRVTVRGSSGIMKVLTAAAIILNSVFSAPTNQPKILLNYSLMNVRI